MSAVQVVKINFLKELKLHGHFLGNLFIHEVAVSRFYHILVVSLELFYPAELQIVGFSLLAVLDVAGEKLRFPVISKVAHIIALLIKGMVVAGNQHRIVLHAEVKNNGVLHVLFCGK